MDKKTERILSIFERLLKAETVIKREEALKYGVTERSIQRDIEDIRAYLSNDPITGRQLIFDWKQKGYRIKE